MKPERRAARMNGVPRIVLAGVESTGKTTLARSLAAALRWELVDEQARAWLLAHDNRYEETDLLTLSDLQWQAELEAEGRAAGAGVDACPPGLVVDTDQCVLRIWSEVRFGRCDPRIIERLAQRPRAHYLLPVPDLPWVPDPQRETPDHAQRLALHQRYRQLLNTLGHPWAEIRGTGDARLAAASLALRRFGLTP